MDFSAARRAGMGSGFIMRFSGELELHDGIGRRDSVGNVLQYFQILHGHPAREAEPTRAPASRTVQCGARRGSSGREGADWGVSCGAGPSCRAFIRKKPSAARDRDIGPETVMVGAPAASGCASVLFCSIESSDWRSAKCSEDSK